MHNHSGLGIFKRIGAQKSKAVLQHVPTQIATDDHEPASAVA